MGHDHPEGIGDMNQVLIMELVRPAHQVGPDVPVAEVKDMMRGEEVISCIVVVSERRPVGLVMNFHLDRILSQRYGVSLFTNQPVRIVMDEAPLVIGGDMPLEEASNVAMARQMEKMYDHLIVVADSGELSGVVSVQEILNKLAALQKRSVGRMNCFNDLLRGEIRSKKKAESELRDLNRELERRVEERTAALVRSNQELSRAKNAAEAANVAKSDFLANMSHELRTPLNHIIGFTDLVLGQHFGPLNAQQGEYLNDVLSSSRHLLSLINDILDLSKVEAGKMDVSYTEIDMQHLLKSSLVMIKEKAMKHNIQLSVKVDETLPLLQADERKMKQILYNLLSNAIKFTPDGGYIRLSAGLEARGAEGMPGGLPPAAQAGDGKCLLVSVTDSGVGIKADDLRRIFDPFEQADGSRSRKYQGTGLGLSLTRKLVESHHGRLWAESRGEGRGATFKFLLPLAPPGEGIAGAGQGSHSEPMDSLTS